MRFLRSLRGGSDEPSASAAARAVDDPSDRSDRSGAEVEADGMRIAPATEEPTDEARAADLMQEFEAALSDLARRQVRYSAYAWEPPAQLDRRGRWVVTEATEGVDHEGRRVALRAGEVLRLDESGGERPDRTSWRFVRVRDGRTVVLAAGPRASWPEGFERPRSGAEG